MAYTPGRVVKLGPRHYRVVHGEQQQEVRKQAKRKPVPPDKQLPGVKYCTVCNRKLNFNNKRGLCRLCGEKDRPTYYYDTCSACGKSLSHKTKTGLCRVCLHEKRSGGKL